MQSESESVPIAGMVLQTFADGRILIEVQQDLAIGDMVQFHSGQGHISPPISGQIPRPKVICLIEAEEGHRLYQTKSGDRVVLRPGIPLCPGDWIEKIQKADCLRVEAIINPQDICFLNGVMEGHSDMAVLRTLDSAVGLVELLASPDYEEEIHKLLLSLQKEMPLEIKAVVRGATSIFL
jgi:hypothetical protein